MPLLARNFARGMAVAAISAMALTGCTSSPSDSGKDAQGSGSQGSGSQGSGSEGSEGSDASGAGVAETNFDDVIVEQDVKVGGSDERTATIGVLSLKVEGEIQTLRLVVTPHFDSADDDERINIYDVWNERKFSPQLLDKDNLKVYSPISQSHRSWTSDSVLTKTENEEPMEAWAVYSAPQDDMDSVDIRLADSWPVFTDVPIDR